MTAQREAVISILEKSEDHPDDDELYRRALEIDESVSIATVYRTVKLLEDANFIEKHEFGDGRARYEESGKHHEHLIDVETGANAKASTEARTASADVTKNIFVFKFLYIIVCFLLYFVRFWPYFKVA